MKNNKILKLFITAMIISTVGIFMFVSTELKNFSRLLLGISIILNITWVAGLVINITKRYLTKN